MNFRSQVSKILNINLSQVKRLGIDEIALVKGQGNYVSSDTWVLRQEDVCCC
jgi:hypothetical protein